MYSDYTPIKSNLPFTKTFTNSNFFLFAFNFLTLQAATRAFMSFLGPGKAQGLRP